jgi:hypothetical protein
MARKQSLSLIETIWREHDAAPFPEGVAGLEVAGICVTSLDTFAAGCIQTYVDSGGRLDQERVAVLASCSRDFAVVVPQMTGEAKAYFARLEKLTSMVLESVERAA